MNRSDKALIFVTMTAMMVIIVALTVMLRIAADASKPPVIIEKTELISSRSFPKIPIEFTTGTYRVRCSAIQKTYGVVQGTVEWSGSAFGLDLSEYGMPEHRYVVTAAHVVFGRENKPTDHFEIQFRVGAGGKWVKCYPLIVDKDRDLALLEADEDLPIIFKLADDEDVGASVVVAGCPADTAPSACLGFLTSKNPEKIRNADVICPIWQASAPFYHGNSGGPVFDAESKKVIAVLVAGLTLPEGGMVPNLAIIIPCTELRKMLDYNLLDECDEPKPAKPKPLVVLPPPPAAPKVQIIAPPAKPVPLPKAEIVPLPPAPAPTGPVPVPK